jgi:hypothetical protein
MPILKSRRLLWEYGYSDLLLIIRQSIKRSGNESEVPPKVFCLTFGVLLCNTEVPDPAVFQYVAEILKQLGIDYHQYDIRNHSDEESGETWM